MLASKMFIYWKAAKSYSITKIRIIFWVSSLNKMENKDLQILIKAAHAGGEVLRKYFGQAMELTEKSTIADFQTKADLESEKSILEILKKEFPAYNILSEEEGKTNN